MNNLFRNIKFIIVIFTVINISNIKAETLEDIEKELSNIRSEISELKTSNFKEAVKIDSALSELDQIVDFVEKNVKSGNLDVAISSLNIAETAVKDIAKSIPSEFKATTVEAGKEYSASEMKQITNITDGLNKNKAMQKQEIAKNIEVAQSEGLDVNSISQNISASGIKTSLVTNTVNKNLISQTNLDNEFANQAKYGAIIGNTPEKVNVAMKQVNVIQSGNPKDHRALEIEKFGIEAGLSSAQIQKGVAAVYSGNLKAETEVTKEIYSKLSQNSDWTVQTADIDAMMQQNIAVEKAATAILKSGIDFAKGTNNKAIEILSSQVATILAGTTDQATIDKITYKIGRTKYEIWKDPNAVAANMIAEIAGPDQVNALVSIKNDQNFGISKSLVEQAASVQANLNGDVNSFIAAGKGSLPSVSLSSADKAQLSVVYSQAASSKSLSASVSSTIGELKSATSIAAVSQAKDLKNANSIIEQNKITMDAFNKFSSTKYEGDGSEWQDARKEWLDASRLTQEIQSSNEMSFDAATKAIEAAGDISSAVGNTAKSVASDASSSVSETAKSAASSVSSSVSETAKSAASSVSTTVSETAKEISTEVSSSVAETAKDVAKEVTQTAYEAAKELTDTAAEFAKEAVKEATKDSIQDQIKDLDIQSTEAFNTMIGETWGTDAHSEARQEWLDKTAKSQALKNAQ